MDNGKIKVSVIMPSLNVRNYIEECIESVINQTLKEIEIICVDAGSTDGTLEVLREYEKKDPRIRVIVSDKKSYGYQMNIGIDAAHGEYIGIVETDDYVLPRMYEELYVIAKDYDVDLVKAGFYRFTGTGDNKIVQQIRLTDRDELYNRVINVAEEQEVFSLVMNTWSGIYKKVFLNENNIRHNESAGASFQDNGFWFQTFAHAKRAFFYDDFYYMNRRDNANSSVYNKNKIYCMCDEYDFIRTKLEEAGLFNKFRFVYSRNVYVNYHFSLEQMNSEYKKEFLHRFAETLRNLRENGCIDFRMYGEVDWERMLSIMEDPDRYWENEIHRKDVFYESLYEEKHIIIYGTGAIGGRTERNMKYRSTPIPITAFAVTTIEGRIYHRNGVPIRCINELLEFKDSAMVVVAVTLRYQKEIIENLKKLGFKKVSISPEVSQTEVNTSKVTVEEQRTALEAWYYRVTGRKLDLNNAKTFNEKQQWLKIFDVSEKKKLLADRITAREWVRDNCGEKYLIPIYGIYDNVEDLNIESFPKDEEVIIHLTHGISLNQRKTRYDEFGKLINIIPLKRMLKTKLGENAVYQRGFEMVYDGIPGRLIIEKCIKKFPLNNFKFLCFNGNPKYVIYDSDKSRFANRKRDVFDMQWQRVDVRTKYDQSNVLPEKPTHFEEMIEIAKIIGKDMRFVVVHLFDTDDGVLFNEVKYSLGCGVDLLSDWFDVELGKYI